jgi:phospholipase/carboxylesterase
MAADLDGPRIEPRAGGAARQLVVFLHGYGADGNDLIEIGRAWQPLMPHAAFVSPHAPHPCGQAPTGREWFPLTDRAQNERWRGVNSAAPVLDRFLDAELVRRNLPPSALALVGFSQGTMMALHVGLRRAIAPRAIVGYSGLLVTEADATPESIEARCCARRCASCTGSRARCGTSTSVSGSASWSPTSAPRCPPSRRPSRS